MTVQVIMVRRWWELSGDGELTGPCALTPYFYASNSVSVQMRLCQHQGLYGVKAGQPPPCLGSLIHWKKLYRHQRLLADWSTLWVVVVRARSLQACILIVIFKTHSLSGQWTRPEMKKIGFRNDPASNLRSTSRHNTRLRTYSHRPDVDFTED